MGIQQGPHICIIVYHFRVIGDGLLLCDMIDTKTLELLIVLPFKERFVVGPLVLLLGPGQSPHCWETSQELETCGRIQIRAERGTVER